MTLTRQMIGPRRFALVDMPETPNVRPLSRRRLDLPKTLPGHDCFNASITRWQGRQLIAYRVSKESARIHIAEVDDDWDVIQSAQVTLKHPRCKSAQEDPRFFEWQGQLCLSFTGVEVFSRKPIVHQMYAVLKDDFAAEQVFAPHYKKRMPIEKNWVFFESDGLKAFYEAFPHTILSIDGEKATVCASEPVPLAWTGGFIRGGASPVRVGDEWWHWFHGYRKLEKRHVYSIGVYTFSAKQPYSPLRITPCPVMWADMTILKPEDKKAIIFVCGATLEKDVWTLSYGVQDKWTEIARFDHQEVREAMA